MYLINAHFVYDLRNDLIGKNLLCLKNPNKGFMQYDVGHPVCILYIWSRTSLV